MPMPKPKTEVIKIRIDCEVYKKIKKLAKEEDRKYGAQINHMLKEIVLN